MNDTSYTLRARRIVTLLPGTPVIRDAALVVRDALVAEAGTWAQLKSSAGPVRDLGEVTLVPAPVNAHTHLELSHIGLAPKPGLGFLAWVRWLIAQPIAATEPASLARAIQAMEQAGTAAVADIATRRPDLVAQALGKSSLDWCVQFERFGYQPEPPLPDVPPNVPMDIPPDIPPGIPEERLALAGHALSSTDPVVLRRAKDWDRARGRVFSMHLAEHPGETELLAGEPGAFADFMRQRVLPPGFTPPGLSPVAWASELGLLDHRTLAVHAVHVSKPDIAILKRRGPTVCLCPRSNAVIGVGRAPARAYLDAGVPCCLGTDSLASSPDLDVFGELRALAAFTNITLAEAGGLLSANAARLYGFAGLGSLSPGSRATFAVLPRDLEEALRD